MPHEVILDSTNGPTPRQICSELIKVAINSRQVKGGSGGSVPIRHGFFYITFDSCKFLQMLLCIPQPSNLALLVHLT